MRKPLLIVVLKNRARSDDKPQLGPFFRLFICSNIIGQSVGKFTLRNFGIKTKRILDPEKLLRKNAGRNYRSNAATMEKRRRFMVLLNESINFCGNASLFLVPIGR